tara:strand:+ start:696 stop:1070 length:375 start_codon:yes stop_codon:yes gene_type:complete
MKKSQLRKLIREVISEQIVDPAPPPTAAHSSSPAPNPNIAGGVPRPPRPNSPMGQTGMPSQSRKGNPGAGKHTVDQMISYMMEEIKNADRKEREPLWKRLKHAISQLNIFGEGCPGPPDCPMPH